MLAMRLLLLLWFLAEIWNARSLASSTKDAFFLKFGALGATWFSSTPLSVLIANLLDPWVRIKVVTCIDLLMQVLALILLVYMMWPTRASKYFEYFAPEVQQHLPENQDSHIVLAEVIEPGSMTSLPMANTIAVMHDSSGL